jgi:hypothetical protein
MKTRRGLGFSSRSIATAKDGSRPQTMPYIRPCLRRALASAVCPVFPSSRNLSAITPREYAPAFFRKVACRQRICDEGRAGPWSGRERHAANGGPGRRLRAARIPPALSALSSWTAVPVNGTESVGVSKRTSLLILSLVRGPPVCASNARHAPSAWVA